MWVSSTRKVELSSSGSFSGLSSSEVEDSLGEGIVVGDDVAKGAIRGIAVDLLRLMFKDIAWRSSGSSGVRPKREVVRRSLKLLT